MYRKRTLYSIASVLALIDIVASRAIHVITIKMNIAHAMKFVEGVGSGKARWDASQSKSVFG